MNTMIHEFAHAFFWEASEENVTKFGNTVTRFLYSQGWRKAKKNPKKNKGRYGKHTHEHLFVLLVIIKNI